MPRQSPHGRTRAPGGQGRKRQRKTAEAARDEILDAAEKRLGELGPDGIRLQQIADDIGVSHPAILHHFKNRDGLISAVVTRAMDRLEADIIAAISEAVPDGEPPSFEAISRAHRVLVENGHARVVAWLSLSGHAEEPIGRVRAVAEVAHRRRLEVTKNANVTFEDTVFRLLLVAFAMFGDAIVGPAMRKSAGLPEGPRAERRFWNWLAGLVT
jgi:AcrR family transcriptional regulator